MAGRVLAGDWGRRSGGQCPVPLAAVGLLPSGDEAPLISAETPPMLFAP
jgi:hypothetical protein